MNSLESDIKLFEGLIQDALFQKYGGDKYSVEMQPLKDNDPLYQIDIKKFYTKYCDSSIYPRDRLENVIAYLFDIKLQYYYLMEFDLGLYNSRVIDSGYNFKNPASTPHLFLSRLSIDQTVITKSRVLWERMMNLIYFLENGVELESKASGGKSKKKIFFEFTKNSKKWLFLHELEEILIHHDNRFRTPELHKKSTLRSELLGNRKADQNEILVLLNTIVPFFWKNLLSIICGQEPRESINRGFFDTFQKIGNESK